MPVELTIIKQGSPHQLVLNKMPQLHHDANLRYQEALLLKKQLDGDSSVAA
jgi:hypothetical protein